MTFAVVGGTQSTGDFITNSLRLNDDDSPKLARTPSTEGNRKTFSISFWQKKANMDHGNDYLIQVSGNNDTTNFEVSNHSTHAFQIGLHSVNLIRTTRLFRDPSAWTHFFFFIDTTQASESNRFQLYVNGIQETNFSQTNIPSQNADIGLGRDVATTFFNSMDAYISDFHYVDGIKKAHTDFGEFDTNGVWVPKEYDGSYGNQGIRLEFKQTGTSANASGIGADTSGNGNHLTPTNLAAIDVTTDTPMNNFCTLSSVDNDGFVLSNGNLDFDSSSGSNEGVRSTIGVLAGKWYYECKITGGSGVGLSAGNVGYSQSTMKLFNNPRGGQCIVMNGSSSINFYNFSSIAVVLDASSGVGQNDIVGVALDLDSGTKTIQFYKNGSTIGSAQTIASGLLQGDFFIPSMFDDGGVNDVIGSFNFGQPTFSISSGNADANGYGNFEYAPPSGYYSLCTKNLGQFG